MFQRNSSEQAHLDSMLLDICKPQDGFIDLVQLDDILKKGANPNSLHPWPAFTNLYGEDQSRFPLLQRIARAENAPEAAQLLLNYGADLRVVDPHTGNTVLHTAIALKNESYTLFLIEKIRNSNDLDIKKLIDQKDTKHPDWLNSPLVLAFKKGLEKVAKLLIDSGADVNLADRYGTQPLHWAALLRYNEIIQELLKQGADPHVVTKFDHNALELYQYELRPLDFELKLNYNKSSKSGSITFTTNLPELSDNRFHGFHRKKHQPADDHICHLLATPSHSRISLPEQYIQNFQMQDAIARSAAFIAGHEYERDVLPILRSEGEHFYGSNSKLPGYAVDINAVLFRGVRRKNSPDLDETRQLITNAMMAFKQAKENPEKTVGLSSGPSITDPTKNETKFMITHPHRLLANSPLFTTTATSNTFIPADLQHAINDSGMLRDCLTKKFVSINRFIELHEKTPYVIDALRCSNIYQGVRNNHITIEQLSELTEEQVNSIEHKFNDNALAVKVRDYIEQNLAVTQNVTSKNSL